MHVYIYNTTPSIRVGERFKESVPEYDRKYLFATVGSDRCLMVSFSSIVYHV